MERGLGNKISIIIIVILIIVVAGWLALLICDYTGIFDWRSLIFKDDNTVETQNDSSSQNDTTDKENKNTITKIEDFPQSSDYEIYNLQEIIFDDGQAEGFEEDRIDINNQSFDFKCSETGDICEEIDMSLNNKKIYTFDANGNTDMIITNDYIILQDGMTGIALGDLVICDKNGKVLKTVENTAKGYRLNSSASDDKLTKMNIVNNNLYFIVADNTNENVIFKYIDLSDNLKEYDIQTFKAITQQEE